MAEAEVDFNVDVQMRDGVDLATDVYQPEGEGPHPTLVHRVAYDKADAVVTGGVMFNPLEAVKNGYAVVIQDIRGRYESEGGWYPIRNESEDGYDTVEWAADQPWSNGRVGIYGSSYMGITTWQTVAADPPHLEAAMPYISGTDYHDGGIYTGGALELGFSTWWLIFNLAFDSLSRLDLPEEEAQDAKRALVRATMAPDEVVETLPLTDIEAFDRGVAPYWYEWLENPSYGEYWEETDVNAQAENISVPILHVAGWYDQHLVGHLDIFERIKEDASEVARENQHFIAGPWTHEQYVSATPTKAGDKELGVSAPAGRHFISDRAFEWFDHWLKQGGADELDMPTVSYFVINDDRWREAPDWPPDHAPTEYYLHSDGNANTRHGDGRLSRQRPGSEPRDSYEFDPLDPVPTEGGRVIMPNLATDGMQDQSDIEEREDVLVYTSPRLTSNLTVAGPVDVTLYAASSAPDTDFTAKLVDAPPDGYCGNVAEGIIRGRYRNGRREPEFMDDEDVHEFPIDLWATGYTFERGHRIRLEISSSNFPRFDRNPNTTQNPANATEADMQSATQNVVHTDEYPSHITLPVLDE